MRNKLLVGYGFFAVLVLLFQFSVVGGLIWAAVHFIRKYW